MEKRTRIVLLSACYNAFLLIAKLVSGLVTGSVSVLSEAVNSATDLVASLIALFAVRRSVTPPDESHNYGHGRFENLAGIIEGIALLGVGGWIVFSALDGIVHGVELEFLGVGIGIMAFSAVANFLISNWLLRKAQENDSKAIEAEGYNLRTDVWAEGGIGAGLVLAWATGWTVLDPMIALCMGGIILWTALRLVSGSTRILLDESLPTSELEVIEGVIEVEIENEEAIQGFHKLRARKSGPQRHIDFHLQLKAETTLGEAHKISDGLEERIQHKLPNSDVLIHLEDDRSLNTEEGAESRES